jgi:probable addiction module antidote protein
MKRYRNYKEHLIERLKDPKEASAYLNAALEEALECNEPGVFQLAVRDVVEAHGGIAKISSKMEVSRESFYRSLSSSGKARFSTLINAIKACGLNLEFHPA